MQSILCFGDSNTYGYVPGGKGRYDPATRFPGALARMLGAAYRLTENGVVGRTTVFDDPKQAGKRGLDDIAQAVRAAEPDLLVLMLGTNDCKAHFAASSEKIAEGMAALARTARQVRPDLQVLLVAPAPIRPEALACGDYSKNSLHLSVRLADSYRAAAERHGCLFWDAGSSAQASPEDGEHLSADGHFALAVDLARIILAWQAQRDEQHRTCETAG